MKKLICAVLALVLLAGLLSGCGGSKMTDEKLVEKGLEIIEQMDERWQMWDSDEESPLHEVMDELPDADELEAVYKITMPPSKWARLMEEDDLEIDEELLTDTVCFAWISGSLVQNLNFYAFNYHYDYSAASAETTLSEVNTAFKGKGLEEAVLLIYLYGEDICCAVSFLPYNDGIIVARGTVVCHPEVAQAGDSSDIRDVIGEIFGEEFAVIFKIKELD